MSDKVELNQKDQNPDPNYWRSLREFYNDPEAIEASHHEFKDGVTDDFDPDKLSALSRRKFLALLGASAALAGAGCSNYRDEGNIIPYTKKPEEVTLGVANYYASTADGCANGCGVLIKTREGRPIKVDGNPDHPVSRGKVCAKCQASILSLYDPERLKYPLRKGKNGGFLKSTWQHVDDEIVNILSGVNGKEIAIISHKIISPSTKKVLQDFQKKFPTTKIYSYELNNEEIRNSAWKKAHGSDTFPLLKWDEAKIVVALEADFLGIGEDKVEKTRLFAKGKDIDNLDNFNRLYVIEGNMSLTGSNADYRLRLRPDAQYEFVNALTAAINGNNNSLKTFAEKYSLQQNKLDYLVEDLKNNRGKSIIYAGRILPEEVHAAVNNLNEILGNDALYRTDASNINLIPLSTKEELNDLINKMNNGNIAAVIHLNSNPAYHFASDYKYSEAIKNVSQVISLVESENESSILGNYSLPINHAFESWGDIKTRTGFYSMRQPVISPIFNTRQQEAVLLHWIEGNTKEYSDSFHKYLMNFWETEIYPSLNKQLDFKRFWFAALHDGVVISNDAPSTFGKSNSSGSNNNSISVDDSSYVLMLKESYASGDGRFANNGWMQELPHPVSKITWDNYAAVSTETAKELGIESNDLIEISVGNQKLELPAFIQPGAAHKTISVELGYGRSKVGIVGQGVGFNAGKLISKDLGLTPWIYNKVSVKKLDDSYDLVTAQEHHAFDNGFTSDEVEKRGIVKEGTVDQYKTNPTFIKDREKSEKTFYPNHEFPGVKWAMAIDLNKCIGCGECVIACNSENNIPVVGKDQVERGREMHWLRIDRYYSGTPDDPKVSTQPMLCQHCDHAPCENVCPVLATTHSPDGLNQMIYNRCVGTRYCSNNCPYKVRRFNFFNFRDHFRDAYQQEEPFNLVYNPEVTVRSRGVMEKCTFCIQRIMDARSNAIREGREVRGSDVKTACQEACGTEAIKFGDMNDNNSEFIKYREHELGYYVLEELNTRPNVTYLAKLRNIHKEEA